LNYITPIDSYQYKPLIDRDIFGEIDKSKLRQQKPVAGSPPPSYKPTEDQLRKLRKLKPQITDSTENNNTLDKIAAGMTVEHGRFGRGIVLNIEGNGQDKKAEINFEQGGIKKLLLRFAKLKVLRIKK